MIPVRKMSPLLAGVFLTSLLVACSGPTTRPALVTAPAPAADAAASTPAAKTETPQNPVTEAAKPVADAAAGAANVPVRNLSLTVYGLSDIAGGKGKLVGLDSATLISAGGMNLISAGGMNLISAGGMNFAPPTAGFKPSGYRLKAGVVADNFVPVEGAVVTFRYLRAKGGLVSPMYVKSDAEGKVNIRVQAPGETLEAEARFIVGGKTYRLASAIPPESQVTSTICPIYSVLCGRIKAILEQNNLTAPELKQVELQAAWDAINESGVTLTSEMLLADHPLEDVERFYQAVVSTIKDPVKKKIITDYVAKIKPAS